MKLEDKVLVEAQIVSAGDGLYGLRVAKPGGGWAHFRAAAEIVRPIPRVVLKKAEAKA